MSKKRDLTKKFWITLLIVFLVLIILSAVGFGLFANREDRVIIQEENGGDIILNYSSNVAGLRITNSVPTTAAVGMKKSEAGDYFDFSVDVTLDNAASIEYDISVIKDTKNSTISDSDIRIYLEQEQSGTYTAIFEPAKFTPLKADNEFGSKAGSMVIAHIKKTKSSTDHYRLRLWLSDESVIEKGNYTVEIAINGSSK